MPRLKKKKKGKKCHHFKHEKIRQILKQWLLSIGMIVILHLEAMNHE